MIHNLSNFERRCLNQVLKNKYRTSKKNYFNNLLAKEFCKKFKVKYAVPVSSGTAGLHAALLSLSLKKNDEVIMPAITMSAVAISILIAGGKPIFADVLENSLNIDPKSVAKRITKKTKAIICVSLYGLPPNYDALKALIKKNKKKIYLIEDNAECVMGKFKNKPAGSFGDFSMFSFQSSKILTCGEGGIILTNNRKLWEKATLYSNMGYFIRKESYKILRKKMQDTNYNRHKVLGYNYKLSDVCAAIVCGQLKKLDQLCRVRKNSGKIFKNIIKNKKFVITQSYNKNFQHSYWAFSLLFKKKKHYNIFKKIFSKNGGEFFYAAWKLPYQEIFFKNLKLTYHKCYVAESVQKRLIQLNTNYPNLVQLKKQVIALKKTFSMIEEKI